MAGPAIAGRPGRVPGRPGRARRRPRRRGRRSSLRPAPGPHLRQPRRGRAAGPDPAEPPRLPGAGDRLLRAAHRPPGAAVPGGPRDPQHRPGRPPDLAQAARRGRPTPGRPRPGRLPGGQPSRPDLRQPRAAGGRGPAAAGPPRLPGAGDRPVLAADGAPGAPGPGRPRDPQHGAGRPLTWPKLLGRRSGPLARATPAARVARPSRAPASGSAGVVYLTFDDGPTPTWTPRVLDLLARYRARATFFVVGRSAATWPGLVRRAYTAGHGVGNHTWSHRRLTGLRGRSLTAEVGATSAVIGRASGARPRCLRPPYGTVDAASVYQARALGLRLTMWDVDPYDWRRPGAGVIAGRVLSRVGSGDVVLLHDGGGDRSQTVAALQQVLASLSARGFGFRALCRG